MKGDLARSSGLKRFANIVIVAVSKPVPTLPANFSAPSSKLPSSSEENGLPFTSERL